MTNLLRNANLLNWYHVRYFTDNTNNTGTIEHPQDWEFIVYPKHAEDPNKLAGSLHRNHLGFAINAGWRSWEAGYKQNNIPVQAGKRYRLIANFVPDVGFAGQAPDLTAVTWRWIVEGGGTRIEEDWQMTQKGAYGQQEMHEIIFHATQDMVISVAFMARSVYAGNSCNLNINNFMLEEVALQYGGESAYMLGQGVVAPAQPAVQAVTPEQPAQPIQPATSAQPAKRSGSGSISTPAVAPIGQRSGSSGGISTPATAPVGHPASNPNPPTVSAPAPTNFMEPSGIGLGDVLNPQELDEIIQALHAMPELTQNPVILKGFAKLAEALEKMK